MKPIEFKDQNIIFAEDQQEYLNLPACTYENKSGAGIISCWKLTWKERFKIFFTGILWINVRTFNNPPQPIRPMVEYPFF